MVGAGRGGPRHAEQRAGRAAPSIHARPGREAAAAGVGTASRGRPARALARAAPRAGGAAGRRRRWRRRQLGAGVEEGALEFPSDIGTRSCPSRAHLHIRAPAPSPAPPAPPAPAARPRPGAGRGRRGGAGGGAGGAGGRARRLLWLSRLARSPGPRPAARPHRAERAPLSHSRGLPAPHPRAPHLPAARVAPARHSAPSPCPAPSSAREDPGRGRPLPLGVGGGGERPRPPSLAADCAPDPRARVGTTGRASAQGLESGLWPRASPACSRGTRIPGAFVSSRQEGPEHSGETIVTRQTASGRTWSLAVTREETRQSQAGGAGGARNCPGSADPRRPVVNCRIGLEQSPSSSACRLWPTPVVERTGCKCGGSTRWLGARPPARVTGILQLRLGSPRGAPGPQGRRFRGAGPGCSAHGRGGRSGLRSAGVRTDTASVTFGSLLPGMEEKVPARRPTGARCFWNESAWTRVFPGTAVSWRPSSENGGPGLEVLL
ncbi:translation initiation factor IF-2-like [Moschus berezovskii]|uniref:translation initiation factor IF-2-like n=1 Tax=Moschus berezovskii TaxID=68408 RepID=UPI0024445CC9|nr:translation initiation factor IF-2-like [Moschus berezovskii]